MYNVESLRGPLRGPLRGIIPPLVLPMMPDGAPDWASLRQQASFLVDAGVHGLWVNGTTGEFHALDPAERAEVVATVVQVVQKRVPVVAQVGDAATRRAIRHIEGAVAAGADYLAAVAPYYLDFSQDELLHYYHDIATASPVPLILYHLPQMTKLKLTVESVLALARRQTIVGIKDSAGDMAWYRELVHRVKVEGLPLRCFVGGGSLVDISLLMGGHGAMCAIANLLPRPCVALYQAASAGDWETAAHHQRQIEAVTEALRLPTRKNWAATVAVYKWLLREQGVIAHDTPAAPLAPLTDAEREHLRQRALPLLRDSLVAAHGADSQAR